MTWLNLKVILVTVAIVVGVYLSLKLLDRKFNRPNK